MRYKELLLGLLAVLHCSGAARLPPDQQMKMSVFVDSSIDESSEPSYHKDTWTGHGGRSNLARTTKSIIRPLAEDRFMEEMMVGVMLLSEVGNNEVFVPEGLIASTKQLLTRVPERLKNFKSPLNFGEKRPVRRHVTGTMMKGLPFSFQYIVDHERSQNFQTRQETKDSMGVVKGCYQVLEPKGLVRTVTYRADVDGFRVVDISKGPDRIPCSGSDGEGFETPFQRDLGQSNLGKTLNIDSSFKTSSRRRPIQQNSKKLPSKPKNLRSQKMQKTPPTPEIGVQSSAQQKIQRQPNRSKAISDHSTAQKTEQIGKEESVLNIINNLSDTLLSSFQSSQSSPNYINFPFVLIPISTFFKLKREGHIDDSVQGFGAVIQPAHNQNLQSSQNFASLSNLGPLFSAVESLSHPAQSQTGLSKDFDSSSSDYPDDSSFEVDYPDYSLSDPSSSYSQVSQTVINSDEVNSNLNSFSKDFKDYNTDFEPTPVKEFRPDNSPNLESSSYANYEEISSETDKIENDAFLTDNFEGSYNEDLNSIEDEALALLGSIENDFAIGTYEGNSLQPSSTINGFTVPPISVLPLQDSKEIFLHPQLSSFPPTFKHKTLDQKKSGTSNVRQPVRRPSSKIKNDRQTNFRNKQFNFGQKIQPKQKLSNLYEAPSQEHNTNLKGTIADPSFQGKEVGHKISSNGSPFGFQNPSQLYEAPSSSLQLPFDSEEEIIKFSGSHESSLIEDSYEGSSDISLQFLPIADSGNQQNVQKLSPLTALYAAPTNEPQIRPIKPVSTQRRQKNGETKSFLKNRNNAPTSLYQPPLTNQNGNRNRHSVQNPKRNRIKTSNLSPIPNSRNKNKQFTAPEKKSDRPKFSPINNKVTQKSPLRSSLSPPESPSGLYQLPTNARQKSTISSGRLRTGTASRSFGKSNQSPRRRNPIKRLSSVKVLDKNSSPKRPLSKNRTPSNKGSVERARIQSASKQTGSFNTNIRSKKLKKESNSNQRERSQHNQRTKPRNQRYLPPKRNTNFGQKISKSSNSFNHKIRMDNSNQWTPIRRN